MISCVRGEQIEERRLRVHRMQAVQQQDRRARRPCAGLRGRCRARRVARSPSHTLYAFADPDRHLAAGLDRRRQQPIAGRLLRAMSQRDVAMLQFVLAEPCSACRAVRPRCRRARRSDRRSARRSPPPPPRCRPSPRARPAPRSPRRGRSRPDATAAASPSGARGGARSDRRSDPDAAAPAPASRAAPVPPSLRRSTASWPA